MVGAGEFDTGAGVSVMVGAGEFDTTGAGF